MKDEITYNTPGGGTVVWKKVRDHGHWQCQGCGDSDWGYAYDANKHAGSCWAKK